MRRIATPAYAMALAATCVAITIAFATSAVAAALPSSHGQLLHLAPFHATTNATQSSNWLGYDQGSLEQGGKLFNSITGDWTVPKATPHASGQAASSSDWIGIGGGCADSGCAVTDQTLIQTGTEQDVSSGGAATYSAWVGGDPCAVGDHIERERRSRRSHVGVCRRDHSELQPVDDHAQGPDQRPVVHDNGGTRQPTRRRSGSRRIPSSSVPAAAASRRFPTSRVRRSTSRR